MFKETTALSVKTKIKMSNVKKNANEDIVFGCFGFTNQRKEETAVLENLGL